MRNQDRFLIVIVIAAVALVVVAFALVARQPEATYRSDQTPDAIAYNYLLALRKGDYARAYGYLSPTLAGRPKSVEALVDNVVGQGGEFGVNEQALAFKTEPPTITGNRAVVKIQATTFAGRDLFDTNQWTETFAMSLGRDGGSWKVVSSERYWDQCWETPNAEYCLNRKGTPGLDTTQVTP
jgi:hypothetical protein